jgi:Right handed beta helix region
MQNLERHAVRLLILSLCAAAAGCGTSNKSHEARGTTRAAVGSGTGTGTGTTGGGTTGGGTTGTGSGPASAGSPVYPGAGSGTTYWIDAAAGDDANPGTQAAPWRTVDRVERTALRPGDLVRVRAGTYDLNTNLLLDGIQGSATAWIGLQAEGQVTLRNSAVANVVSVQGCAYLFLRGFTITHDNGGAAYGAWDGVDGVKLEGAPSQDVSLDGCTIHSVGNVGVSSQTALVERFTVYGCEIRDCYTGLYWGYYEDANKRYAHFGRIARSYIHDCPPQDLDGTGYGIQIKGGSRGNVIEDNVLVNVGGGTRAGIAIYHASTDTRLATNEPNVIRRNLIRASRNEGIYASEGAAIENNVVVDAGSVGINLSRRDSGGWGVFYGALTVRHNTVYRVADPAGRGLRLGDTAFTGALVVSNNLLLVDGPNQLALRGPGAFAGTATQNLCFGATQGGNLGVSALTDLTVVQSTTYGDPGFLLPAASAAAVDSGDPAQAGADDFFAGARDARPDVGAFEAPVTAGWPLQDGFKP